MIDGFLYVDKPVGFTSFDVVAIIRNRLGVKRVGHAGTLDPFASGLLIVAVGRATKFLEYIVGEDKEYETTIFLGATSTTYDPEGNIVEKSVKHVPTKSEVEKCLQSFTGEISQIPPKYSALKIGGKKAYELVRKGQDFEMQARQVRIHDLSIIDYNYPNLSLDVTCSKGTYIRSLGNDIGQSLGTGGYLVMLKRTAIGPIQLDDQMIEVRKETTKEQLVEHMVPIQHMTLSLDEFVLSGEKAQDFLLGKKLPIEGKDSIDILAKDQQGRVLGIGKIEKNILKPKKVLS